MAIAHNANQYIEDELDRLAGELEEDFEADLFTFSGDLTYGADLVTRDLIEGRDGKRNRLVVVLETTGGYIEVVQRIVDILRNHYGHVEFVIPNYAMSAGTVLAMSGDVIHMDYFSIVGPIDPQVERPDGRQVPALGYLLQYEKLMKKAEAGELNTAEMAYLVAKFDPAELYQYEQARNLSITLLKEWLAKYKFKNWTKTETQGHDVTPEMRQQRAVEVAEKLNDTDLWHTHGRGISMEVLTRDVKLKIEDFGAQPERRSKIHSYHKLLYDYMSKMGMGGALHTRGTFIPVMG